MKKCLLALLAVACLSSFGGIAQAAYPEQPITVICAWDAGGGTDAVARILASLMQKEFGVPVNVVNRSGGGGAVGLNAMVSAKPDGYTLGLVSVEIVTIHWMDVAKTTPKDATAIALVNVDPAGITTRMDAPWTDYNGLAAYIKANPGKLTNSGTGHGAIWHLAQSAWLVAAGMAPDAVRFIPSKGAAPAMQDIAAGSLDMCTASLPEAASMIEAKKARPVAIMADKRDPNFPDTPTLKELGVNMSIGTWRGVIAPKGLAPEIVDKLEAVIKKAVASAEYVDFMNKRGFGVAWMPAKEFGAFMEKSDAELGATMKTAGLVKAK